jgi:hypothetical protein
MPKRIVALPRTTGMEFDIVSYGRRGPSGASWLSVEQIEQVKRTVSRVPEVMVKVSGGARDSGGAVAHLKYLCRHGKLEVETDDGLALQGRGAANHLVTDWQLDLCRSQYKPKPGEGEKETRAKLVHNIVLSMPAGTPPQKVLLAARDFARENFALQYRYAMVLHTDQHHPHVHLVVKCEHEFEPGRRLYIRKDTLRHWREQFAALMRAQGVAANATPRQLRGQARTPKRDPIHHRLRDVSSYRAMAAGAGSSRTIPKGSTFMRSKFAAIGRQLRSGALAPESGKETLSSTRAQVTADWRTTAGSLRRQGKGVLARRVEDFVREMQTVQTDNEHIATRWREHIVASRRVDLPERSSPDEERSR